MIPIRDPGESSASYARRVGAAIGGDFERYLNRLIQVHEVEKPQLLQEVRRMRQEIADREKEIANLQEQINALHQYNAGLVEEGNRKRMKQYQDLATLSVQVDAFISEGDRILRSSVRD